MTKCAAVSIVAFLCLIKSANSQTPNEIGRLRSLLSSLSRPDVLYGIDEGFVERSPVVDPSRPGTDKQAIDEQGNHVYTYEINSAAVIEFLVRYIDALERRVSRIEALSPSPRN